MATAHESHLPRVDQHECAHTGTLLTERTGHRHADNAQYSFLDCIEYSIHNKNKLEGLGLFHKKERKRKAS